MKMNWKAIISWRTNSYTKMYLVSSKVAAQMKGNKYFPESPVKTEDEDAANERLIDAYNKRKNGDAAKIELKLAAQDVDGMLRKILAYVNITAQGSEQMVETSGFDYSNGEHTITVTPGAPDFLKLTSSRGSVVMRTTRVKGANGYCWIIYVGGTITPISVVNNNIVGPIADNVIIINPGKTRQVLSDLPVGTLVTVMVLAQNTAGKSPFSAQASIYVNKQEVSGEWRNVRSE